MMQKEPKRRPAGKKEEGEKGKTFEKKKFVVKGKTREDEKTGEKVKTFEKKKFVGKGETWENEKTGEKVKTFEKKKFVIKGKTREKEKAGEKAKTLEKGKAGGELIRLNKFISNSGVCSRREADRLIEAGAVTVNGKIVTELGTKVSPNDKVSYDGQPIRREKMQYVLLNKPKGFITTMDDPDNRRTVMSLVEGACRERIYPVGRLDLNTTGLLLFTNDGEVAKKLTHPRYGIKKIYHVELDKALTRNDYLAITKGFNLDGEFIRADQIEYVGDGKDKKQIGVELHSGQNRIVRRIFEHFEYKVIRLDRVYYAGLTKKNLPRGSWRFLEEKEINLLKMISSKP